MAQLILNLMGRPEVFVNGQPVKFPTRKTLALLIYVVVEARTHARDTLTALFWPESGSSQGRSTLRSTLAMLRAALGEAANDLAADRETVRLETDAAVELDLRALQAAALATRQLPLVDEPGRVRPNLEGLMAQLRGAAELYRGDYLEGFSLADAPDFDNWASLQREACHRQAGLVFDWLSQLQSEGGELASATITTRRWVSIEPLNESAHRRLMLCLAAEGDRSRALQAYAACRDLLARELKAEPAPETEALAQRLRTQAGAAGGRAPAPAGTAAEAPLVGRAAEHMGLVAAFRQAAKGQLNAVVITGEPGIGKTRLAQEFLAWAGAQGAEVMQGRAYEMGGRVPYQPVVDALRGRLGGETKAPQWLSDTWLAELSRLLPELRDNYPALAAPLPLADNETQARLFEAVVRAGQGLAQRAPAEGLVVFLDDWQWADAASLDLLAYAAHRWAKTAAILLLLAVRSDDLSALDGWLGRLGRELLLTRLTLEPLTRVDTLQLTRAVGMDTGLTEAALTDLGEKLFADTAGRPFYVLQSLKSLAERQQAGKDEHAPEDVPTGIRDLIRARLSRLGAAAIALVQAGAVLGTGFDFETARRMAEMDESVGLDALETLTGRGLLRESDRLYFTHDRLREVAYGDLNETRRRVLHRRALEALAETETPPAELARHALAAGQLERAFHWLMTAGDDALRLFAARDALGFYERAEALLPDVAETIAARLTLHLQLGRAHEIASEWGPARTNYERLLVLARDTHQPGAQGLALARLAAVFARGYFDLRSAAGLLREARQLAEQAGDPAALIEIDVNLAQVSLYAWDAPALIEHAESALAAAQVLDRPELMARCLNMLAYAGTITSEWGAMGARAEQSRALYAAAGNQLMQSDNLALVSAAHTHSGRLTAGLAAGQAAYDLALLIENDWAQANSAWYLAHALLEAGQWGPALQKARAGVAAARAAAHPPLLAFNLAILGRLYRTVFALEAALTAHLECQAIGEAVHQPLVLEWAASELCADFASAGEWGQALDQARRALAHRAHNAAVTPFAGQIRWYETEALVRGGELVTAVEDLDRFDRQVGERQRYRVAYLRAKAVLAEATRQGEPTGQSESAANYLTEAKALAEVMGLPAELWPMLSALGQTERAAAIAQSLAAGLDDERLRAGFLRAEAVRAVMAAATARL